MVEKHPLKTENSLYSNRRAAQESNRVLSYHPSVTLCLLTNYHLLIQVRTLVGTDDPPLNVLHRHDKSTDVVEHALHYSVIHTKIPSGSTCSLEVQRSF